LALVKVSVAVPQIWTGDSKMVEVKAMRDAPILRELDAVIFELKGRRCCCQRVGEHKSLWLGFGEKMNRSKMRVRDPFFGEWQIGTYTAAWRIVRNDQILLGSRSPVDSSADLDAELQKIQFGPVELIEVTSRFCVRVHLEGCVYIDFIAVSNVDSDMFFILKPDRHDMEYRCTVGWNVA
jgi:hypothetical protein